MEKVVRKSKILNCDLSIGKVPALGTIRTVFRQEMHMSSLVCRTQFGMFEGEEKEKSGWK